MVRLPERIVSQKRRTERTIAGAHEVSRSTIRAIIAAGSRVEAGEEGTVSVPVQAGAYAEAYEAGRPAGIRAAADYILRVGNLMGSNEQRLKMAGAPELLRELADAVEAGKVEL